MSRAPLRLVISCPDRPGIVAAVSRFLAEAGANIVRSDQYSTDPEGGTFFLRMGFTPSAEVDQSAFAREVAEPFGMTWRLWDSARPKRVALLVSREGHCLYELLWRWRQGDLECEIVSVVSNHEDHRR